MRLSQLGTPHLSWRRLFVLLSALPTDCALQRAMHGAQAMWGLQEQLLAAVVDTLQTGNWQRSGDKKAPRPKAIPRPGVVSDDTVSNAQTYGTPRPLEEVRSIFEKRRASQLAAAEGAEIGDGR